MSNLKFAISALLGCLWRPAVIEAGPLVYLRSFANGQVAVNLTEWPVFLWFETPGWKINGNEDPAHNTGEYASFLTTSRNM